jgi:hypothetical protein
MLDVNKYAYNNKYHNDLDDTVIFQFNITIHIALAWTRTLLYDSYRGLDLGLDSSKFVKFELLELSYNFDDLCWNIKWHLNSIKHETINLYMFIKVFFILKIFYEFI